MSKSTMWAGRCPSQGQITPARLCPGSSGVETAVAEEEPCQPVLAQVGMHSSVGRQPWEIDGQTCAYTSPGPKLKCEALNLPSPHLDPRNSLSLQWELVYVLGLS